MSAVSRLIKICLRPDLAGGGVHRDAKGQDGCGSRAKGDPDVNRDRPRTN